MIIARAPLRISFFGGGTDYPDYFLEHGGAVLGSAIEHFAFVTAVPFYSDLFEYNMRISYREIELVNSVNEIRHGPFREALKKFDIDRDVEINYFAELPANTGLGSSSTFSVALMQALHEFKGRPISGLELAYEAIKFERGILKESVGCQDQTFAAVGGFNLIEFRKEDDIAVHPVDLGTDRLKELESHLLLVYTGIKRRAEPIVQKQLRVLSSNLDRYISLLKMVEKGLNILTSDKSITAFGELLDKAWLEKRLLHPLISNDQIDKMYDEAKSLGAIGGKLLGAGGGGFLLLFVPPESQAQVIEHFRGSVILFPKLAAPGSKVIHQSKNGSFRPIGLEDS